ERLLFLIEYVNPDRCYQFRRQRAGGAARGRCFVWLGLLRRHLEGGGFARRHHASLSPRRYCSARSRRMCGSDSVMPSAVRSSLGGRKRTNRIWLPFGLRIASGEAGKSPGKIAVSVSPSKVSPSMVSPLSG